MKLYEINVDEHGYYEPITIKGRKYDVHKARRISKGESVPLRAVYQKENGEYFLLVTVFSVGFYIAPLSDAQAECLLALE